MPDSRFSRAARRGVDVMVQPHIAGWIDADGMVAGLVVYSTVTLPPAIFLFPSARADGLAAQE